MKRKLTLSKPYSLTKTKKTESKANDTYNADAFTTLEFRNLLNDPAKEILGFQKFSKACARYKVDSQATHDVVKAYVTVSPECSEIFKCLGSKKRSTQELAVIFDCLLQILLRIASDLNQTFSNVGHNICSMILQSHLQKIYQCLGQKHKSKATWLTLRLLTAMVMQSKESARDVANHLDFSMRCFEDALKETKTGNHAQTQYMVRQCFIHFILSFFLSGDAKTSQKILEVRGFVSLIFKNIKNDSASLIQLFLGTLEDKVIKNTLIPKTARVRMLAEPKVLLNVSSLFKWDGVMDIEQTADNLSKDNNEPKNSVAQIAYDFLFHCCCPFKYGINFKDKSLGTSGRSQNHVLLNFITRLPNVATDPYAKEIVIQILKTCPDLLSRYLTGASLSFEPRSTTKWNSNCKLVEEIYKSQPDVSPALTQASKSRSSGTGDGEKFDGDKLVKMILPGIFPSVFTRFLIKQCLKNESWVVKRNALRILHISLVKAKSSFAFMADASNWLKSSYTESEVALFGVQLREELAKHLIDFPSLVSLWNDIVSNELPESTSVRNLVLHALCLFHEIFPETIHQCNFDFTKLLFGLSGGAESNPASTENGSKDFNDSTATILRLFSQNPEKYKWFKSMISGRSPFHQLLLVTLQAEPTSDIAQEAVNLIKKILVINELIDKTQMKEVDKWIQHLPKCKIPHDEENKNEIKVTLEYFDKICGKIIRQPSRYTNILQTAQNTGDFVLGDDYQNPPQITFDWWESLLDVEIELTDDIQVHTNTNNDVSDDISTDSIPLLNEGLPAMSLLVAASLDNLRSEEISVNENKPVIDRYLCSVISELFHSLTSAKDAAVFAGLFSLIKLKIEEFEINFPLLYRLHNYLLIFQKESTATPKEFEVTFAEDKGIQGQFQTWFWNIYTKANMKHSENINVPSYPYDVDDLVQELGLSNSLLKKRDFGLTQSCFHQLLMYFDQLLSTMNTEDKTLFEATKYLMNAIVRILEAASVLDNPITENGSHDLEEHGVKNFHEENKYKTNIFSKMAGLFLANHNIKRFFLMRDFSLPVTSLDSSSSQLLSSCSRPIDSLISIATIAVIRDSLSQKLYVPSDILDYYFSKISETVQQYITKVVQQLSNADDSSKNESNFSMLALTIFGSHMPTLEILQILKFVLSLIPEVKAETGADLCCDIICKLSDKLPSSGEDSDKLPLVKVLFNFITSPYLQAASCSKLLAKITELLHDSPSSASFAPTELFSFCYEKIESHSVVDIMQYLIRANPGTISLLCEDKGKRKFQFKLEKLSETAKIKMLPVLKCIFRYVPEFVEEEKCKTYLVKLYKQILMEYESLISKNLYTLENATSLAKEGGFFSVFFEACIDGGKKDILEDLKTDLICKSDSGSVNFLTRLSLVELLMNKGIFSDLEKAKLKICSIVMCLSCIADLTGSESTMDESNYVITEAFKALNRLLISLQPSEIDDLQNEVSQIWNKFIKKALRHRFEDARVLQNIVNLLPIVYRNADGLSSSDTVDENALIDPPTLKYLLTQHSKFLPRFLDEQTATHGGNISDTNQLDYRSLLCELYYKLCLQCDSSHLSDRDLSFLLGGYGCTLTSCDQTILKTLLLYEKRGITTRDFRPYVWGHNAISMFRARRQLGDTLWKRPNPNELLVCIESDVMERTLSRFPVRRRMIHLSEAFQNKDDPYFENDPFPARSTDDRNAGDPGSQHVYDPCYLLPAILDLLSAENLVDSRMFIRGGALSYLFSCLASHCPSVRSVAATCLSAFCSHAEAAWFPEKNLALYLTHCVRNGMATSVFKTNNGEVSSIQRLPAVVANFLSTVAILFNKPEEHMYSILHRYLLVKPQLDLKNVPEFFVLFFSAELEYKTERSWILNSIVEGLRDMGDFHTIQRRNVAQLLMCFHDSPLSDNHTRRQIFQVFEEACRIRGAAFQLVNKHGFVSWLMEAILSQHSSSKSSHNHAKSLVAKSDPIKRQDSTFHIINVLRSLWKTLNVKDFKVDSSFNQMESSKSNIADGQCKVDGDISDAIEIDKDMMNDGVSVKKDGKSTEPLTKRATLAPFRVVEQIISLSINLLDHLLNISGFCLNNHPCKDKVKYLSSGAVIAFTDVITVLHSCISNLRERRQQSKLKSPDNSTGCLDEICDIQFQQAKILFECCQFLNGSKANEFCVNLVQILSTWISLPSYKKEYVCQEEIKFVKKCMKWILTEMFRSCLCLSQNDLIQVLLWFERWMTGNGGYLLDDDFKSCLVGCYDCTLKNESLTRESFKKSFECIEIINRLIKGMSSGTQGIINHPTDRIENLKEMSGNLSESGSSS